MLFGRKFAPNVERSENHRHFPPCQVHQASKEEVAEQLPRRTHGESVLTAANGPPAGRDRRHTRARSEIAGRVLSNITGSLSPGNRTIKSMQNNLFVFLRNFMTNSFSKPPDNSTQFLSAVVR